MEDIYGYLWDCIYSADYKGIRLPHELNEQEKAALEAQEDKDGAICNLAKDIDGRRSGRCLQQ